MAKKKANSITKRAKRDADLMMVDEFSAIATMKADAETTAKNATKQVTDWATQSVKDVYKDFDRQEYDIASAATAANMGTSGFAMAGVTDLNRKAADATTTVRTQQNSKLGEIATNLQSMRREAERARQTAQRKHTLLIGQLSDQYRQEAEQIAAQKEANRIAAYNARTSRMALSQGKGKDDLEAARKAKIEGIKRYIYETRTTANQAGEKFYPSQLWKLYANDPDLSDADKRDIWGVLYPGGTPYPGDASKKIKNTPSFKNYHGSLAVPTPVQPGQRVLINGRLTPPIVSPYIHR